MMQMTTLVTALIFSNPTGYLTGAIIALLIFGYLFYSLFKPEKF